jgi:hypothetical protein
MDSSSQELLGLDLMPAHPSFGRDAYRNAEFAASTRAFDEAFDALLAAVATRRLFLAVLERFEESLLVLHHLQYRTRQAPAADDAMADLAAFVFLKQKEQVYDEEEDEDDEEKKEDEAGTASSPAPSTRLSAEALDMLGRFQSYDYRLYQSANAALDAWLRHLYPAHDAGQRVRLEEERNCVRSLNAQVAHVCSTEKQRKQVNGENEERDAVAGATSSIKLTCRNRTVSVPVDCALLRRDNREAVQSFYGERRPSLFSPKKTRNNNKRKKEKRKRTTN